MIFLNKILATAVYRVKLSIRVLYCARLQPPH